MTVAAAKTWIDGQMLPNYRPVAGASVTPDASYGEDDLLLAGAFTPPTGSTHTANRVQVSSPATAALTPDQPQYVGAIVGTVSGCTAGAVAAPIKDPISSTFNDQKVYDGFASGTANATLSTIAGPGGIYVSPYGWRSSGGVLICDCPGNYVKGRFTKTSLVLNCDVSALVGTGAVAGDYPWVAWSIDGGALQRAQLTSGGTITLATGIANATHTFIVYYEAHAAFMDTWGFQNYTLRLAATPFTGDASFVLSGPATIAPRTYLFYGASIEYGITASAVAPLQRATSAWTRAAGAAMQCEYGVIASSGQGWVNQIAPGVYPYGVPRLIDSWSLHFDGATSRLVSGSLSPMPDAIIITEGTNDAPFDPLTGTGFTDANVSGAIQYLLPLLRAAAATAKIVVMADMRQGRLVALQAGVAAYQASYPADLATFYADPGHNTLAQITGGSTIDGIHPTTAGSVIIEPMMRHAALNAMSLFSAYTLNTYQHTDSYQGRQTYPIDETGCWHFSQLNVVGDWRLRVIKNSDGSQQGAEWSAGTNGYLSSGVVIDKYKYSDSYYRIQSPEQVLEPAHTDVLINPAGTLTLGLWSCDSLGYPGEWRFRLLNSTTLVQIGSEWQGVNGNNDTYDGLEIRFVLVNDTDYPVQRQLASTTNRWFWFAQTTGRHAVRIHAITDSNTPGSMPAPKAEWTMTTGLPRSSIYAPADPGYGTRSEDLAFVYDIGLTIGVYLSYGDWATSLRICLGLCAVQFADGPWPFAVFQRYVNSTWDRYIRMGGGVAHPAYALALHIKLAPKAYQDPRINAAVLAAAAYMDAHTDATGLVQGGEGINWPAWTASTAVTVGTRRVNSGNVYEVITAGNTAASGGPTGTGSNITDGTAHWKFIVVGTVDPQLVTYHATEHNVGCWLFRNLLYEVLGRKIDQVAADRIRTGLLTLHWNDVGGYFWQSTDVSGVPDGVTTLDSMSWGGIVLVNWGELAKANRTVPRMDLVPPGYVVTYAGHTGYRTFSGDDGILKTGGAEYSGLWPEGTFGVAFAYYKIGNTSKGDSVRDEMLANQSGDGGFRYLMTADAPDIPQTYENMGGTAWCVLCQHRDVWWAEKISLPFNARRLDRVEVWSDLQANGGVMLAILEAVIDLEIQWSLTQEQQCVVTYSREGAYVATLENDENVILLRYDDGSAFEWPIHGIEFQTSVNGSSVARTITVTCHDPKTDLAEWGLLRQVASTGVISYDVGAVNLTPEEYVTTLVLPDSPPFVVLGRITVSVLLTLQFSKVSPAAALDQIVQAIQNIRNPGEWAYRRLSNTAYAIDIVDAVGGDADIIELRLGVHIITETDSRDATDKTTAVIAFGKDGATMAHAAFKITNIAGLVVTIEDETGIAPPILVNDQLNTLYVLHPSTGVLVDITDSAGPTPSTITLATVAGLSVGQRIEFRADADGTHIAELTLPGRKRKFGSVADDSLDDGRNYVPNAFQDDWTGGDAGPPDGWTFQSAFLAGTWTGNPIPTIGREVGPPDPDWGGTNIAHIRATAPFVPQSDGTNIYQSYKSPNTYWLEAGEIYTLRARLCLNAWHAVFPMGGVNRKSSLQVQLEDLSFPVATEAAQCANPVAFIQNDDDFVVGEWFDLNIEGISPEHSGLYRVRIAESIRPGVAWFVSTPEVLTITGLLDFYVGAVQVTPTPKIVPYFDGSHAAKIWHLANYQLANNGVSTKQYQATVLDWSKIHAEGAQLSPTLGGTCRIVDEEEGTSTLMRLVAYTEKPLQDAIVQATFSTQRNPITQLLARVIAMILPAV